MTADKVLYGRDRYAPTAEIVKTLRDMGKQTFYARQRALANKLAALALEVKDEMMSNAWMECRKEASKTYEQGELHRFPLGDENLCTLDFYEDHGHVEKGEKFPFRFAYIVDGKIHWTYLWEEVVDAIVPKLSDEDFEFLTLVATFASLQASIHIFKSQRLKLEKAGMDFNKLVVWDWI